MADKKISALTGASTPLVGTEVLPIVQSGATVKVAVSDLTAGRDVATKSITTTLGNVSINAASSGTPLDVRSNLSATTGIQTVATFFGTTSGSTDANYAAAIKFYTKNLNGNYWNSGFGAANSAYGSNYADATVYWGDTGNVLVEGIRLQAVSGDVQVKTGNLVIGTSGKGIDFSATPGTGTSELFADYEEGTWTPTVAGLTVVGTPTYTGRYTKIGRLVTFDLQIESTTSTTATYPTTTFTLPFNQAGAPRSVALVSSGGAAQILTTFLYPPNWTVEPIVWISGSYSV